MLNEMGCASNNEITVFNLILLFSLLHTWVLFIIQYFNIIWVLLNVEGNIEYFVALFYAIESHAWI